MAGSNNKKIIVAKDLTRQKIHVSSFRRNIRYALTIFNKGEIMSKKSRRPNRVKQLAQRKINKKAEKILRQQQRAEGFISPKHVTITNCKCWYESVEEEIDERI
ncbi:MAG: hypothetical protein B6I30_06165, partial [Desulfobacteraceae bacterium 4572_187]